MSADADNCPTGVPTHQPYHERLADFRATAYARYAEVYFSEYLTSDVDTIIFWGSGSSWECALLRRWAILHGLTIRFVCVEKDEERAVYARALRELEQGDWEHWTVCSPIRL